MRRAALVLGLFLALAAPAAAAPKPAPFRVGAAVANIDPIPGVPVYSGGFGMSPPLTDKQVHDPLEVRAIYVSNGKKGVAVATVDAQAMFASYQDGPGFGITDARQKAAAKIGGAMTAGDVIVQSTHSHAAPTLEGIWGPVAPAYLKKVHDAIVQAVGDAAKAARPASLQWG